MKRVHIIVILFGVTLLGGGAVKGEVSPPALVFTEIMYNPESADNGGKVSDGTYFSKEWVELHNASSAPINLTDWKFNDGANHLLNIPPEKGGQGSMVIPPGGFAILTDDAATFLRDHPGFPGTVIDTVMSLTNTSKTISLINTSGAIVDTLTYQNTWGADGNGYTLEKKNVLGLNDGTNWQESSVPGGTPGAPYTVENQAPIIENQDPVSDEASEPVSSPAPPATTNAANAPPAIAATVTKTRAAVGETLTFDASDTYDPNGGTLTFRWDFGDGTTLPGETVTHSYTKTGTYTVTILVNDGALEAYDTLSLAITEPYYASTVFINEILPNSSGADSEGEWIEVMNESGELVDLSAWQLDDSEGGSNPFVFPPGTVITAHSFLVFTRPQTKIALNNDKDEVRLIWPNGRVLHEVTYEKSKEGWSAARFGMEWEWTSTPTSGSTNVAHSSAQGSKEETIKNETVENNAESSTITSIVAPLSETSKTLATASEGTEGNKKVNGGVPSLSWGDQKGRLASMGFSPSLFKSSWMPFLFAGGIALGGASLIVFLKKRLKSKV